METPSTQRAVIDQLYEKGMAILRKQEDQDLGALVGAYQTAYKTIINKVNDQVMSEGWGLQSMQRTGRLQAMMDEIHQVLMDLKAQQNQIIEDAAVQQFNSGYQQTVYAMDQATPQDFVIPYTPPPMEAVQVLINTDYKGAMFSQRIGMITDGMASDIRDELVQSLINGEGIDDVSLRIRGILGADDPENLASYASRADTIARTEIMRAQGMARDFTYEQNSDIVDGTEWVVTPDDALCPWCMRREGLSDQEIEDAEPVDAASGKEDPWGTSSEQPLHPRCRCAKAPKLKSWSDLIGLDMPENLPDDFRGMRDEDGNWQIQPVETFNNWLEQRQLTAA